MSRREAKLHLPNFKPPENSWILLDSDVFIDAANFLEEFDKLWDILEKSNCVVVTLSSVEAEFLQGSRTITSIAKKRELISEIVDSVLPVDKNIQEEVYKIISVLDQDHKPGLVDLHLAAMIMVFQGKISLMTSNASDFPSSIFDRSSFLILEEDKKVKVYSLYSYNEKKFNQRLQKVLRERP